MKDVWLILIVNPFRIKNYLDTCRSMDSVVHSVPTPIASIFVLVILKSKLYYMCSDVSCNNHQQQNS